MPPDDVEPELTSAARMPMTVAHSSNAVRLEDLTVGSVVHGVSRSGPVTVVATKWHGSAALTLTYRDSAGRVDERIVYRDDEPSLSIESSTRAWSFDADGDLFRLAAEARRIQLAHLFDPMLAVSLSQVDPLPHQIQAVYGELLPRQPLRFLLADDPGAGKTIMAGLYIKELLLRGDLARCLIVTPGGLVGQWQEELYDKFGLTFEILTREAIESSLTGNPFAEKNLLLARLDHLSRNEDLQAKLAETDWDLIVVDEAHRMAAHWFGSEVKETGRYRLGKLLGSITRNFLLMTATPHAGKEEDFQLFLALLDADRFEGRFRDGAHTVDISDLMRRMIKEKLLRMDGRPLFPERIASTVPYPLSDLEQALYDEVTTYVTDEMNRADRLAAEGEGRRGNRVGFALTVLQRRLASSPEAIYQSLRRRRERLERDLIDARNRARMASQPGGHRLERLLEDLERPSRVEDEEDDFSDRIEDLADDEREDVEEELVDSASAARTAQELEYEIATLQRLEELAGRVRRTGTDRKWSELVSIIDERPEMRHADGSRRKLIVFTEHRDTMNYLVERLRGRLGRPEAVVSISGSTSREERRAIQERFTQDKECIILVATDAAGEGLNLQRAHLLVNYDLPWNPNRIEQRFGRVHRIGQTEVCHLWNLVAEDTREGQVYLTLLGKLDEQRKALSGQVFDVLGEAFRGAPLRDLLLKAIRYGDQPDVRAQIDQVIDARVGDGLAELIDAHALASDVLGETQVERIRAQMEEAEARRLQPHYIRSFFMEAFGLLGGRIVEREPGRFEIRHVPQDLRDRDRQIGVGAPVLRAYERVCFEKEQVRVQGKPIAELLAPGHPLLDAVLDVTLERHRRVLAQGTVLVDDHDHGSQPRVLAMLEHAIADGRPDGRGAGRRVISRQLQFVDMCEDGTHTTSIAAPYLDLRPANEKDQAKAEELLTGGTWLAGDLEARALDIAISEAIPTHLARVRAHTVLRLQKVRSAVHERLTREINYWDFRANELEAQVQNGKQPKMNPDRARQRADDLAGRLRRRMEDIDRQEELHALPPAISGAALVLPAGMLATGEADGPPRHARETERVERRAVDAVLATELRLGRDPREMAHNNPGYDIESTTRDRHLLFLEVKGRVSGAETVTITRNEILTSLNTDRWILALVEVSDDDDGRVADEVRYLHHPFRGQLDDLGFKETSRTFPWRQLWDAAGEPM
jgi:superfamily II DNA or RNA helicase